MAASAQIAPQTIPQLASQTDGVVKRALWLYGLYMLLNNAAFLLGYYFLPAGFMRGSPQVAVGGMIAQQESFWGQFTMTLFFNLLIMPGLAVLLNLTRVRDTPTGYVLPITLGIIGGLIAGTNSFAASDLTQYNAWEGTALSLSIGGMEMLGYVLIVAATANLTTEQYRSWWRWSGEWKPTKVARLRDLRLIRAEIITIAIAALLIVIAAYQETAMAFTL